MAENREALAAIRIEKAEELLRNAKTMLDQESYMSANNRAFYSIEKSIKALLKLVPRWWTQT